MSEHLGKRRGIKRKTFGDPMEDASDHELMGDASDQGLMGDASDHEMMGDASDQGLMGDDEARKLAARENLAHWLDKINMLIMDPANPATWLRVNTPGIESIIESLQMSCMFRQETANDKDNEKCTQLSMCCIQAGMVLRDLSM
jgi:hypothetical protein